MLANVFFFDALDVGNLALETLQLFLIVLAECILSGLEATDLALEWCGVLAQCACLLCLLLALLVALGLTLDRRPARGLNRVERLGHRGNRSARTRTSWAQCDELLGSVCESAAHALEYAVGREECKAQLGGNRNRRERTRKVQSNE